MDGSLCSFTAATPPPLNPCVRNRGSSAEHNNILITGALVDVRTKYHVSLTEIGHGHYGIVRRCMDRKTNEWYAIKSIRKAKVKKIEVLKREISILKEVKHPHIIELVDVFEDAKYLHLVTELCTGGELFDAIIAKSQSIEGHYSEHDAASIINDILDAIAYCHSNGIVHRDLKPEVSFCLFIVKLHLNPYDCARMKPCIIIIVVVDFVVSVATSFLKFSVLLLIYFIDFTNQNRPLLISFWKTKRTFYF